MQAISPDLCPAPPSVKNLLGQPFGSLVVIGFANIRQYPSGKRRAQWYCACRCGHLRIVSTAELRSGDTKTCGHHRSKYGIDGRGASIYPAEWHVWHAMWRRCVDPQYAAFAYYGGRGITVDPRWRQFRNFLANMGLRPYPKATLERLKVNGPYSPENCVWASRAVQSRNTRRNRWITHDGLTQCAADWARGAGLGLPTFLRRIQSNWSMERALRPPA
jgi:hypothetical protein